MSFLEWYFLTGTSPKCLLYEMKHFADETRRKLRITQDTFTRITLDRQNDSLWFKDISLINNETRGPSGPESLTWITLIMTSLITLDRPNDIL